MNWQERIARVVHGRRIRGVSVVVALAIVGTVAFAGVHLLQASHADTPAATFASSFVTRSGSSLMLNGKAFRFGGANMYWVALDDNIRNADGSPSYPTHYRVDDGFSEAESLGATVVRAHSVGISVGCSTCLEPSLGVFNDAAFASIDYAVESAGKHNIKLMVPLIDQWRYYHGGKWDFVHWAYLAGVPGVSDTNSDMSQNAGNSSGAGSEKALEEQFYTNPTIIADYEAYLSHLLNHVNQYTGVALKNDPTIMAWETGNELFDAPTSWTSTIAAYLKNTIGVKQLVADGSAASGNHDSNADLTDPNIDIVGGHFYAYPSGLDTSWLATDAATAHANNKAYIIGEYAWSRPELPAFLKAIETNANVSGDMLWTILPHEENGTPEPHGSTTYGDDDVSLYVPGTDSTMQADDATLKAHFATMSGVLPAKAPTISLSAPASGATLSTATVTVSAAVTKGDNTVSKVDFFLDGSTTALKTVTASPYSFSWDTTSVANGSHTIEAIVTDSQGLQATASSTFTVTGSPLTTINDTVTGTGMNQINYVGSGWTTSQNVGEYQGDDHYTFNGGDYATVEFTGTQVKYWYSQDSHHGIADVSIDGGTATTVDLYNATRTNGVAFWASPVLKSGTHTLKILNSGTKNASSSSTAVIIDRIDVLNGTSVTPTASPTPTAAPTPTPTPTPTPKATATPTPTPTPTPAKTTIAGDANGDGRVNAIDLSILLVHDGQNYPAADFNKDGTVDAPDLAILLSKWTW